MGETQLWELIKTELSTDQIAYFESEFLPAPSTSTPDPTAEIGSPIELVDTKAEAEETAALPVIFPAKIATPQDSEIKTVTKKTRQTKKTPKQKAVKKRTVGKEK